MLALLGQTEETWVSQAPDGLSQKCAFTTFTPSAVVQTPSKTKHCVTEVCLSPKQSIVVVHGGTKNS